MRKHHGPCRPACGAAVNALAMQAHASSVRALRSPTAASFPASRLRPQPECLANTCAPRAWQAPEPRPPAGGDWMRHPSLQSPEAETVICRIARQGRARSQRGPQHPLDGLRMRGVGRGAQHTQLAAPHRRDRARSAMVMPWSWALSRRTGGRPGGRTVGRSFGPHGTAARSPIGPARSGTPNDRYPHPWPVAVRHQRKPVIRSGTVPIVNEKMSSHR